MNTCRNVGIPCATKNINWMKIVRSFNCQSVYHKRNRRCNFRLSCRVNFSLRPTTEREEERTIDNLLQSMQYL